MLIDLNMCDEMLIELNVSMWDDTIYIYALGWIL